jgi:hypothetical protein
MKNAQTEALEDMYDDASQAWQQEPTEEGRTVAIYRWGRLIATLWGIRPHVLDGPPS